MKEPDQSSDVFSGDLEFFEDIHEPRDDDLSARIAAKRGGGLKSDGADVEEYNEEERIKEREKEEFEFQAESERKDELTEEDNKPWWRNLLVELLWFLPWI